MLKPGGKDFGIVTGRRRFSATDDAFMNILKTAAGLVYRRGARGCEAVRRKTSAGAVQQERVEVIIEQAYWRIAKRLLSTAFQERTKERLRTGAEPFRDDPLSAAL